MKILHLEDSPSDAELIKNLVIGAWPKGCIQQVDSAAAYQAALKRGDFDLILSDFALPGFDGLTALDLAQVMCPGKPFIFLSGTIGEERAIEAMKRGAADYVIKDRPGRLIPAITQAFKHVEEIAARRRSEEALRLTQERYRLLVDNARDVIFALTDTSHLASLNPAFEALTGWDPAQWIGREYRDLLHADDLPQAQAKIRLAHAGETLAPFELRINTAKGGHLDMEFTLAPQIVDLGIIGIGRDVTERNRALARIREQADIIERSPVAVVVTDMTHRVIYANEGALRLYGLCKEELLGQTSDRLFTPEARPIIEAGRIESLATGEWRGEVPVDTPDGRRLMVELFKNLIRDETGRPKGRLTIAVDVTEKRRMATQIQRAERMDSIGMLAGGVAHDLNNALAPIIMASDLLRTRLVEAKDLKLVDSIMTGAQHGADLVHQLLAFARGTEGKRTMVRADLLVGDVAKLLRSNLPGSIELVTRAEGELWPILGDATTIKQALINLCINARDAMPEGGRIEIHVENATLNRLQVQGAADARPGPYLRMLVRDTGTGIPAKILAKIFDPFFTTKAVGKGTGLGLSMVAGIVKSHGGFLNVESEPGQGTVFELHFPAAAAPGAATAEPSATLSARGHGESFLLIDDDPAVGDVLRQLLEKVGYSVTVALNGPDGLQEYERTPGKFALVIIDMKMLGMSGPEVIAAVRALDPKQAILAISGFALPGGIEALRALEPPVEYLPKPLLTETLLATLERMLRSAIKAD